MSYSKVLSVILGGGQGSRLQPLTSHRSKPAVPVAAKYRLVDIPISNCINSKLNKIFVLTQFNSASLNHHIKNTYVFDLFSRGYIAILAAEQTTSNYDWYQGTADAVRQNFPHFEHLKFECMLILSGDQLYHMDYRKLIDKHRKSKADLTIATIPVDAESATGFGIMKTDDENKIVSFIEKPSADKLPDWVSDTGEIMKKQGKVYLASMGIYLFSKKVLEEYVFDSDHHDFGKHIIPDIINRKKVMSFQHNGYWEDIGTVKSFHEANLNLAADIPKFNLYDKKHPIYTRPRMLPPAKIVDTELQNAVISEGAIVHAKKITNSIVGLRTRIGKGTVIEDTYIMGSDSYESLKDLEKHKEKNEPAIGIGENCIIKNAIIDKNVCIGNNVVIEGGSHLKDYEDENIDDNGNKFESRYKIIDGVVVIKKDMKICDNLVIPPKDKKSNN